jgi:hypothetical protein
MLPQTWDASSAWQVKHCTWGIFVRREKIIDGGVAVGATQNAVPLAACLLGSIEMLLPLAEVLPAWPWQARRVSSCLSGWAGFA